MDIAFVLLIQNNRSKVQLTKTMNGIWIIG